MNLYPSMGQRFISLGLGEDFNAVPSLRQAQCSPVQIVGKPTIKHRFGDIFGGEEGNVHNSTFRQAQRWNTYSDVTYPQRQ